MLQWLGTTAFRPPVPAYRHDAALFFQLRGWAESDATPEGAPRRSAWERDLLASILARARGGQLVVRRRDFPQVKNLKRADAFLAHLDTLGVTLPFADPPDLDALGRADRGRRPHAAPNRFCILPMEGWDGTDDGRPTDLVRRRWSRFGTSGAGLVWGGEAFAVRPDGRANPHQLCLGPTSADDLAELRALLDRRPGHRPPAHPQRPLVGRAEAGTARPAARRPPRRTRAHRRRARRPRRRLRHRRPPGAATPASTSST